MDYHDRMINPSSGSLVTAGGAEKEAGLGGTFGSDPMMPRPASTFV